MSNGHTPGPWAVERADDAYCIANVGNLVIMPCGGKVKHDNAEADARLIAAAPDLLKACEALVAYDDMIEEDDGKLMMHYADLVRLSRAAIAKARGTPC
jgi:2-oxo-4-hydroxy-4-carboxy--5-ureidoimidazoline (OHCU) decarboxylase